MKLRPALWTLLLLALLVTAQSARAGEAGLVEGVSLTVYNEDLALIRELRTFDLTKGEQTLLLSDVSGQLEPPTVHLAMTTGPQLSLLEQNFDFDLIDETTLLSKFIGKAITLVDDSRNSQLTGTLLSVNGGLILQAGGKLLLNPPGGVVLPESAASGLLLRPTLSWLVNAPTAGKQQAEISYLSGGLSWNADYVLLLGADDKTADLNGWVTLTNNRGTAYRDAQLKIVAGEVNRVPPPAPPKPAEYRAKPEMPIKVMGKDGGFEEQSLFEYHLYELGRQTTIANNQQKQIELLKASDFPVKKLYVYDADEDEANVMVSVEFKNEEPHGLGIPLPAGTIRVFKADASGQPQYLREDEIKHTPRKETLRVGVGSVFDILGSREVTDHEDLATGYREKVKVKLTNAKRKDDVVVTVVHHIEGDWSITTSSLPYVKKDASTVEFQVPVKADSSKELTFTYKVTEN